MYICWVHALDVCFVKMDFYLSVQSTIVQFYGCSVYVCMVLTDVMVVARLGGNDVYMDEYDGDETGLDWIGCSSFLQYTDSFGVEL